MRTINNEIAYVFDAFLRRAIRRERSIPGFGEDVFVIVDTVSNPLKQIIKIAISRPDGSHIEIKEGIPRSGLYEFAREIIENAILGPPIIRNTFAD
jgi:hypothetical protein